MEDSYVINGGKPLKGNVTLSGAKNVALKAVIAALLFDGKVTLRNIPRIRDIFELLHLIRTLGGRAEFIDTNTVIVDGVGLKENKLDFLHASKIRVSFMLFAPLLYRFKEACIPNPGGCRIGARPIDRIVEGMNSLGIQVSYNSETGYYKASMKDKPQGSYTFLKPSHTGSELMIMLSIFCKDKVTIHNCALEPEIDDLIGLLNSAGARIKREGVDIVVEGVTSLVQQKPYTIVSDRNEAVTFAVAALITQGNVALQSIREDYIATYVAKIKEIGGGVEKKPNGAWRFYYKGQIKSSDIVTDPHPGFMTDWQPNWAILMTQSKGISMIHERVFENRFSYVDELVKIGAHIEYFNPPVDDPKSFYGFNWEQGKKTSQAIKIYGGEKLHNGVLTISDLRAGATLVLAALMTHGESIVNGASILERGYERFVEKVTSLGGDIKKV